MRNKTATFKSLRKNRMRELLTDFFIGVGVFFMVTTFAGAYEAPALPAPLINSEAMVAVGGHELQSGASFASLSLARPIMRSNTRITAYRGGHNKTMLIMMALLFTSLSTITFQFWRHLRREYASPRRKRGRG